MVRLTSQIKQEFESDSAKDRRPFHFSTGVTTLAAYQLGKPLRQLRKQYPKAEICVTVDEVLRRKPWRDCTIAVLTSGLITLPVPEEGLKIMPLFEEELLILRHAPRRVHGRHTGTLRGPRPG